MPNLKFLLLLIPFFILSACSASIEDVKEETKENVEASFTDERKSPNEELKDFSLYLPFGMKVDDTDPTNTIIKKGDQIYILFINPIESMDSRVVYESTLKNAGEFIINETFEEKDKFGFLLVREINDDGKYELTVGIGGYKLTTDTDASEMADNAGKMMEILSSIQLKKQ